VHLQNLGRKSADKAGSNMKALQEGVGHIRADTLSTSDVERYQQARLALGRQPATVNRECELLREAFRRAFAVRPRKVTDVRLIPMLTVENARQGFLSRADLEALAANIKDSEVRDFIEWFWWTGMRPNEIRQLTWEMFNADTWTLTLNARAAKTSRGRVLALEGPLRTIIQRRCAKRRPDTLLIFHRTRRGQPGRPIRDYRKIWKTALENAKLPMGLVPYDLRRSAVRNLIRAGVHETVAMKISGHRTRSTFDRYNIGSLEDLRDAVQKVTAYVEAQPKKRKVAILEDSQNAHKARRCAPRDVALSVT
jgi:integrase